VWLEQYCAFALQAQNPEFKLKSQQKQFKKNKILPLP
jgi:hypothetical protein